MSLQIDGIVFSLQRHGGISVYFRELAARLRQRGADYALSLESPTLWDPSRLPGSHQLRPARRLERIRACRIAPGTTVFHSSYYRQPADRRVASVVTVHDFIHERFGAGWRRSAFMLQKRAAIRSAQALICVSQATRDDLMDLVGTRPGQSLHVIPNGVAEVFRPLGLPPPPRPYVLFVGERGGYKNFRLMLEALALLPDLELHCVGGGALRDAEVQATPADVRARVRHLGYVDDEALNRHYNAAACLAYPSSYEGFGIPVLEAMRAGCPVVATDCKAVREIGGDALTVADAAPAAIAAAIERLTDPVGRALLGQKALAVAGGYSWESTHCRTMDVYRTLGWKG